VFTEFPAIYICNVPHFNAVLGLVTSIRTPILDIVLEDSVWFTHKRRVESVPLTFKILHLKYNFLYLCCDIQNMPQWVEDYD
jgi:hypothetical protein